MSPTPDSPLDDPQQIIAELQRQLAESNAERDHLRSERDEALERETATAEVLQVINSSLGDLAPVFDAILRKSLDLCEAAFGVLRTFDGEFFHVVAVRGEGPFAERVWQLGPIKSDVGLFDRLASGEDVIHITDVFETDVYRSDPAARERSDLGSIRSCLFVALRKEDALLGTIIVFRQEVRPFADQQIALLENFAAQAVIAMENARLITETHEALEQQTATAEVLGVINSSPGDLAPVFDAILEKAHAVCDAATGSLQIYDGESIRAVTTRGLPDRFANLLRERRQSDRISGMRAAFLQGVPYFQISDTSDAVLTGGDPGFATGREIAGVRTLLHVPLRKDGELLGVIASGRLEVRPFSDKEIALLQNFAAQAVIAMENARLLGDLRTRTDDLQQSLGYQTATSDVLKVISRSTFDLQPILDTLVATAARLCNAEMGSLFTREGGGYRVVASFAHSSEFDAFARGRLFTRDRGTVAGRTVVEGRVVHVADLAADPEFALPEAVSMGRLRTVLGVPLLREGESIGVITLSRQRVEPFTERQIELVRTFADQAVIAMENARLLGELRQRTEEVGELNRDLEARVAEQVDELGRVGRLKRFLAPQLAELIVSQGDEKILESHRREIVVVFCDLRGYTAFTETAEPEEVLEFLRQYHGALGPLVSQFEGTLDQFSGDGIMVFFNDPVPCPDPAERAVKMGMAMREAARELIAAWRRDGCELGFGAGIAQGYATLGQIGFSERSGYTAIGTVCNLAARLCAEAKDGQILISSRVARAVDAMARLEDLGNLELKGLRRPVAAFNVGKPVRRRLVPI